MSRIGNKPVKALFLVENRNDKDTAIVKVSNDNKITQ